MLLLSGIFMLLNNSTSAYSQYLPCNIVSIAPTGPPTVGAGQTLQVTTAVTGSCDQSMFYAVRVDLVDVHSSQVVSSIVFPYAPISAVFTVTITNRATAPTVLGAWVLQVNAYLIASLNGVVVASSHLLFNVVVVPYTPPSTTTTEQMTTNSTTTLSMMPANSTTQMTSSETSLTSSSPLASPESANLNTTLVSVAVIIVIVAVFVIILLSRRKGATIQKTQPQQQPNVKYCVNCGTKLMANDEFCGHCGAKQA